MTMNINKQQVVNYNDIELLKASYYATVDAYYNNNWYNFTTKYHAHTHIEIMYILKGCCTILVEKETFFLKRGEYILINANTFHQLIVEKECQILNLEFHFEMQNRNIPSFDSLVTSSNKIFNLLYAKKNYYCFKDSTNILYTLQSILTIQSLSSEDKFLINHLNIIQLLLLISQSINSESVDNRKGAISYVFLCIEYIEINYNTCLSVDILAKLVNLHPTYLQKIFKEYMNCTLVDYITNIRLSKSLQLLTMTDFSISSVSESVGINTVQYYIFLFKKKYGKTPLQYRKSYDSIQKSTTYESTFITRDVF